ncbi:MAG: lipopolysaccharide biosynthesis protein [Planctomycetota bacterium]
MNGYTEASSPESDPPAASRRTRLIGLLKSKFIKDMLFLQAGTLFTAGTYMLTSILLARHLGPYELGRYGLADRIYTFCFFLVNMSLINVTIVHYSQATGMKNVKKQVQALAAFLKLYAVMIVAILALGFYLCPLAGEAFYQDREVGLFGWLLCFMGLFDIMRAMVMALLQGLRRMGRVAWLDSSVALLRLLIVLGIVLLDYGLRELIYAMVAHALLSSLVGFGFYAKQRKEEAPEKAPRLAEILKAVPSAPMKQFFSLSLFIALNKNMYEIAGIYGTFLMAKVSFSDAGYLRIAWVIMWGLTLLLGAVTRNLLPTLGFKLGNEEGMDISKMGGALAKVSVASGVLFAALTGLFLLVLPWLVDLLYGEQYMDSVNIVMIIASSHLVFGFAVILDSFYIYANRIRLSVIINFILFILLLPLGYLGMVYFGQTGVAWYLAAVRIVVVVHLVYIFIYFRRARLQRARESASGEDSP